MKKVKKLIVNLIIILLLVSCAVFAVLGFSGFFSEGGYLYQLSLEKSIEKAGGVTSLLGSGSYADPFLVRCKSELLFMDQFIEEEEINGLYNFSLANDIDMKIGAGPQNVVMGEGKDYSFQGVFFGNGHKISNLVIEAEDKAGLFEDLKGQVYDLYVEGEVKGGCAGGIAGQVESTGVIANCIANVTVTGETAGGIAGVNYGKVVHCVDQKSTSVIGDNMGEQQGCYRKDGRKYLCTDDGSYLYGFRAAARLNSDAGVLNPIAQHRIFKGLLTLGYSDGLLKLPDACEMKVEVVGEKRTIRGFFSEELSGWAVVLPEKEIEAGLPIVLKGNGNSMASTEKDISDYRLEIPSESGNTTVSVKLLSCGEGNSLFIDSDINDGLKFIHESKENEVPGRFAAQNASGSLDEGVLVSFKGRGNDSYQHFDNWKNSFALSLKERQSVLGLPENEDYVLLAGFREDSTLPYIIERDLFKSIGIPYAYDYRMVQLFIDGDYRGYYMLTGSQEIDSGRYDLVNSYEETVGLNDRKLSEYQQIKDDNPERGQLRVYYDIPNSPEDVSGGYLLEVDYKDYPDSRSRFISREGTTLTMKSNSYASKAQVDYAADLWQDFEDALFSESGYNEKGGYFGDYMDLESLADLCLTFEINEDSSMAGSVYFYTDAGDGKLHAGSHWDSEKSFAKESAVKDRSWLGGDKHGKYEDEGVMFWWQLYQHPEFIEILQKEWNKKFVPALDVLLSEDEDAHMEGGLESIPAYVRDYGDSAAIDNIRWPGGNFGIKADSIRNFLEKRRDALGEWL